ncbi:hypothetical protein H9657_00625 [Cellulomonas sp. Sa3CUA2]|uniref:Uncharacterized protein n=1 Tax=Cellulomonas avistercoris TaxID=2762242 RepID=A0ABR8Q8M8_9CELL|nr:hypothetical protein [Cellulomonas avistercoris]MBD7916788.1 hypothetical protein [Cellulomonas avistercoris]
MGGALFLPLSTAVRGPLLCCAFRRWCHDPVPTHHFADHGSEGKQWARELQRCEKG